MSAGATIRIEVDSSQLDAAIEKAKELLALLRDAGVVEADEPTIIAEPTRPPAPYRIGDIVGDYADYAGRPLCGRGHDGWVCTVTRGEGHDWHVAIGSSTGKAIVRDVWPA